MTGCPNGCARPYLAEIALVGRTPGIYNLYLGGAFDGTRLNKLYRKDVPRIYSHRYRLYLNRRDMRRQAHLIRQLRGRKFISGPKGENYDLEEIFDLGHYTKHAHAIVGRLDALV